MKAVVAAFNQEKALVGAFSVLTNLRMELFQALAQVCWATLASRKAAAASGAVTKDSSRHLSMFAKIFTVLGFTWISEIVSTALHVEHHQQTFHVRLFLDLVNLFLVSGGIRDDVLHGHAIKINSRKWCKRQGVREKAQVFETLNFFGKGLTQIETDVQLL